MALIDRIKFDAPSYAVLVWKLPSEELKLRSHGRGCVEVAPYIIPSAFGVPQTRG